MTNAAVVILSVGAAYFALGFQSLMEYIQLILSTFNAPLFALVALAVILPRRAAGGGRAGFLIGLASAVTHQILAMTHVLHYGSQMAANFYGAILGFCVALVCTLWIGSLRASAERAPRWRQSFDGRPVSIAWPALAAGIGLAGLCVAFNVFFW
jgi:SSS family solute:Na+ symporter